MQTIPNEAQRQAGARGMRRRGAKVTKERVFRKGGFPVSVHIPRRPQVATKQKAPPDGISSLSLTMKWRSPHVHNRHDGISSLSLSLDSTMKWRRLSVNAAPRLKYESSDPIRSRLVRGHRPKAPATANRNVTGIYSAACRHHVVRTIRQRLAAVENACKNIDDMHDIKRATLCGHVQYSFVISIWWGR
jgi:hypothetical protein